MTIGIDSQLSTFTLDLLADYRAAGVTLLGSLVYSNLLDLYPRELT